MTDSPLSRKALSFLDNVTRLSDQLKNGDEGAREGLLGVCSSLVSELSNLSENMLR